MAQSEESIVGPNESEMMTNTISYDYGPRPLKWTRRHGPFGGLVTCDFKREEIVIVAIFLNRQGHMTIS